MKRLVDRVRVVASLLADGMAYDDIAAQTGLAVGSVRVYESRARKAGLLPPAVIGRPRGSKTVNHRAPVLQSEGEGLVGLARRMRSAQKKRAVAGVLVDEVTRDYLGFDEFAAEHARQVAARLESSVDFALAGGVESPVRDALAACREAQRAEALTRYVSPYSEVLVPMLKAQRALDAVLFGGGQ